MGIRNSPRLTLSEAQQKFTLDIAKLVMFAAKRGLGLTYGDAYRDPRAFKDGKPYGHPQSLHGKRLAVDFNLFENGEWKQNSSAHWPLGTYWESLDPMNRWGGRWDDGNHYERRHV